MLSFLQFSFAILVIMLHCSRLFQNDAYHFIQKSLFSRMAVPFFLICSSFFVRAKTSQDPQYQKTYIKNYTKNYLLWSIIYIPYGFLYFTSVSLPAYMTPLGILVAIFYTGMCYHLWYPPAFLTGFYLVNRVRRVLNLKYTTFLFFVIYLIGSIETYSAFFKNTKIMSLYLRYTSIFFTSRNGLFYAPIFICLGYILYDHKGNILFTKNYFSKLLISFLCLCIEGLLLFPNQGFDKNFLFTLMPFSLFLFNWSIRTNIFRNKSFYKLKQLSTLYFFIHPVFIELISIPAVKEMVNPSAFGWVKLCFTLIGTHFSSVLILRLLQTDINEKYLKKYG